MPHLLRALLLAAIPAAFLCLLTAIPLWKMLDYGGSPLWLEMLHDSYYRQRILWTATQAACTVLLTLLLGLPCAWALARLQFSGKALILRLLMLPFIMPTLVAGMGVLALFGEKGLLWRGWQDTAVLLLYGNIFFNLPVLIRSAYQGLLAVPANRIAAAKTLGANAWQQFWHVELPVLRPWLASAGCLIFLYCFSGFGLALLLGGQQYATAEVEIYRLIAHELDLEHASVLVWLVLFATAAAGLLNAWFSRQTHAADIRPIAAQSPSSLHHKILLGYTLFLLTT
nr:ABC transporter permease subunit [Kingella kingae]